jgi:hypothetical protein
MLDCLLDLSVCQSSSLSAIVSLRAHHTRCYSVCQSSSGGAREFASDYYYRCLYVCQKSSLCTARKIPFMYSFSGNSAASVPISTFMCLCWAIYIFPGSVHIFPCSRIGRPILEICKSHTDIWVKELGYRTLLFCFGNNSFISGNTKMGTRHLYWILTGPCFAVWVIECLSDLITIGAVSLKAHKKLLQYLSELITSCRIVCNSFSHGVPVSALQMKGRWKSYINVWFPFIYSQKWNCYFQNRIIMFCLPVSTLIYLWETYMFPRLAA